MQRSVSSLNVDISTKISDSIADLSAQVQGRVAAIEQQQQQHGARLSEHDTFIAEIRTRVATLEAQQAAATAQVQQLHAAQITSAATLATATQSVERVQQAVSAEVRQRTEAEVDADYAGPPNGTILRLHVREVPVAKTEVERAIRDSWIHDTISSDQWRLEGPAEAHRFVLRFLAFPKTASMHVREALELLKPERPSEPWTEVQVTKDQRA